MSEHYKLIDGEKLSEKDRVELEAHLNATNAILDRLQLDAARIGKSDDDIKLSALRGANREPSAG